MRMVGEEAVAVPDAEAWVEVGVRAGRDGDPNIYREYTDSGKEFAVTRERYENDLRLPETEGILQIDRQPGIRASIGYDSENWSFWSSPIAESGTWLDLRNGSYLQLQITLQSRAFGDWVELDSLWIETSPLLADQILGEVARAADMQPAPGFVQVELGARETFVYDVRASFASAAEGGFDRVRIHTGIAPEFARLEMGDPLAIVEPLAVVEGDTSLEVVLPQKVTAESNELLRVVFDVEVFARATTFTGEVLAEGESRLPQPIEPGDASAAVSTNSLRVLGAADTASEVIQRVRLSSGIITPNGDGVNDRLAIEYALFTAARARAGGAQCVRLGGQPPCPDGGRCAGHRSATGFLGRSRRAGCAPTSGPVPVGPGVGDRGQARALTAARWLGLLREQRMAIFFGA